jgi:2-iminobutanoate/2-iminopropanoate deaminase
MRNVVRTEKAPKAVGPYSQAVYAGEFLYLSGQVALDPETGKMVGEGDPERETEQVMRNILGVLSSQGMDFGNVIKATIYAMSMEDFPRINRVYAACFDENPPARSFVQVAGMALNARVEIEVIAHRG